MGKVSTATIRRPKPVAVDKVFQDPASGLEIPMRLRRLGRMESLAALDISSDMTARYVTGFGNPEHPDYRAPETLPPVDGQPVFVSEPACRVAAAIQYAQVTLNDEDRYSFEEIIAFMTLDTICDQMTATFAELTEGGDTAGDPLGQTSGTPSQPTVAGETPSPIPRSSEES